MKLKTILIFAPLVVSVILVQSYFWVPSYEVQTVGNPTRVEKFINSSIGDAKILNPIIAADGASSDITTLVFEGLLDLDENLNLRGRLATEWQVTEKAYLIVVPGASFADGSAVTAITLEQRLRQAIASGLVPGLKDQLLDLRRIAAEERVQDVSLPGEKGEVQTVRVRLHLPARIQISLKEVDQDLFKKLATVIGPKYADSAPYGRWIEVEPANMREAVKPQFSQLVPVFEHNPIIEFKLRQGVRFHDGHEFDAGDVKFTYDAIMNPKNLSPRTSDFEPIKRIEISDPYTIKVVYKRLFSPAINAWMMGIIPEHLLNDAALKKEMDRRNISAELRETFAMRESEFSRNPVGVGPYQFVEWQSDEMIHLQRNEDYWEGAPQYKDYYYRIIPDKLTQEVEFRSGAVDRYSARPHQIARYKKDTRYQSFSSLGFGYTYIGYNNRLPLFKDPRLRKALGMAIDVKEIIKYILYDEAERVTGPYPKNTQWYDQSIPPLPYDPAGAIKLLNELGWKKNADGWLEKDGKLLEFNLLTNNGNPIRKAVVTIAQNAWKKIGVKCNTQLFEWAVFLQDFINPGKFDAVVLGWSLSQDPDLFQLWHSSEAGPQKLNFVGYNSPQADELIVRIRKEYNVDKQRELTHRLHRQIANDQPYTFLFAPRVTELLDKKIVMMEKDGSYSKIKPSKSGRIYYSFNKWKKLEHAPEF
ncbi:MAG TPA: peptide ABC transporter substrate-binding protein [Acidiferrobacteraceae bacterium]|nr:peptide ABC transporter substrate-binding protein [Acidiferrobacteraceae bacterium]